MFIIPFFSRQISHIDFSETETNSISNDPPTKKTILIIGTNFCISLFFSMVTYLLTFTDIIKYSFNSMLYSNSTTSSILIPKPDIQYIQWLTYFSLFYSLSVYRWKSEEKQVMSKLYDMTYYMIPINILQIINNVIPYEEMISYFINSVINAIIISILIALFLKEKIYRRHDKCIKSFSIDIPLSLYYQTSVINLIFTINQILFETDNSLIYNDQAFLGLMIVLLLSNFSILFGTKNIFQSILYIFILIVYGGNTFNLENQLNYNFQNNITNYITETTIYNMRIYIIVPFIVNIISIFSYSLCFYDCIDEIDHRTKNRVSRDYMEELKEQII